MVGRGIQEHYDFQVDFEQLANDIEMKKRAMAVSCAQRRDQIATFIKKKEDQEAKSGTASLPIDSQQN